MAIALASNCLPLRAQQHRAHFNCRRRAVIRTASHLEQGDEEQIAKLLDNLSDSLVLPSNFLKTIPKDLQVDVKDAAFALSNGPVTQECGDQVGDMLLKLGVALEQADTEATAEIGRALGSLQSSMGGTTGPALGRRLISAGRYLRSTGQYGQGEFQKMASALSDLGEAIGGKQAPSESRIDSSRVFKFGTLQVQVTSGKSFSGAAIAFVFAIISWQLAAAVQASPDSSFNYPNENASLVASSLQGALVAMGYTCAALSTVATLGLLALGLQLSNAKRD